MSELSAADQEIMRLATEDAEPKPDAKVEAKPEADDTLELGSDEAPKVEEQPEGEPTKTRSKRWESRVDNLTARLRAAEQEAATLRAQREPKQEVSDPEPDPNETNPDGSDKYQFGEADPRFLRDYATYAARKAISEERALTKETEAKTSEQTALTQRLSEGMASIEKTGAEKYDDFQDKITEAVESRGGEPLPPLISIGIAVSPAGADIAYRLATDEPASDKLEKLAQTNPPQAAIMFGELEGTHLDPDWDDSDLNPADQWDVLRMLGRERARRKGLSGTVERKTSKAPEPPENRARGAGGKFEVGDDTEDFAAFERKIMGKR